MNIKRTPEDKILSVLEMIKEQNDLNPEGDYSVSSGAYGRRHSANEVEFYTRRDLLQNCDISYTELEKILAKLQAEGLIKRFTIISEYA